MMRLRTLSTLPEYGAKMFPSFSRRTALKSAAAAGAMALAGHSTVKGQGKPRLKIGQIGVGHAHASKLEVYRRSADYEVVGIVEPDQQLRERAGQQPAFRDLPWISEEQ